MVNSIVIRLNLIVSLFTMLFKLFIKVITRHFQFLLILVASFDKSSMTEAGDRKVAGWIVMR